MQLVAKPYQITGAVGQTECLVDEPLGQTSHDYVSVCCHPHPQHGGTLSNKVIYTVSRSIASLGIPSIRFNFRGIGKSQGEYAEGIGELDDLTSVVRWAQEKYPDRKLILAGFSFGARIAALQAKSLSADLLITVAPPVGRMDFSDLKQPSCPWLIVQGEKDELVDAKEVELWANSMEQPPELIKFPDVSHFFHGKLVNLREAVTDFVAKTVVDS